MLSKTRSCPEAFITEVTGTTEFFLQETATVITVTFCHSSIVLFYCANSFRTYRGYINIRYKLISFSSAIGSRSFSYTGGKGVSTGKEGKLQEGWG